MTDSSFGTWLRQKRKALDLTRQDLALRAACAAITIEKIEIGERRPSTQVAEALANALDIPVAERAKFIAFARGKAESVDGSGLLAPSLFPNNLPSALPPLIGRDDTLVAVQDALLRSHGQLVTLTGPGGVGKTLLALHAAQQCARGTFAGSDERFARDGVVFVNLVPVRHAEHVVDAIAQSLAAMRGNAHARASLDALKEQVHDRAMLFVLDNFEQVSDAAPQVAELASACPKLTVLITSRAGLSLEGSRNVAISPLHHASAVSLFIARACEADPRFKPTTEGAQAIDTVCRKLDGLPLAIELVAARVKLMTPQQLLARLTGAGDRLRIDLVADGLSDLPARQRTLREAIAWSYNLLTPHEQDAFRRMAVFVGGCDLRAAESVLVQRPPELETGDASVARWNALISLMDKSLLKREAVEDSEPRFTMLETVREFALERLQGDEAEAVARQHAEYFYSLALEAEPCINGSAPAAWLQQLERDQGNLRAALRWHTAHDALGALRFCVALGPYWHTSGLWNEGRVCLEASLDRAGDAAHPVTKANALYWLGRIARKLNDWANAWRYGEDSVALYRGAGDERSLAQALMALGWAAYSNIGHAEAAQCFEEGLALYRRLDDKRGIAQALLDLSHIIIERDTDYERAARYLAESRALFRQLGDDEGLALVSSGLAIIACLRGEYAYSRALLLEGLEGFKRIGAKGFVAGQYLEIGEASYFLGDLAAAEQEWQTSLKLHRELGSRGGVARTLYHLARLRRIDGQLSAAMEHLVEALYVFQRLERDVMSARCVAAIGGIALVRGQVKQATTLLSAAQHYFDSVPPFLAPADQDEYDRDIAACRARLSSEAFTEAWAAGEAMTLAEACEWALGI